MAFTVDDFEDLYRLLSEHPDWRARLRPLILGDEFVELPQRIATVEKELGDIRAILNRIAVSLEGLIERVNRTDGRLGNIEGDLLELRYAQNMGNWFRTQIVRPQRVFVDDLELLLAAIDSGAISEDEVERVVRADLIIRGKTRKDSGGDLILIAEVSTTVNLDDVERAEEAAAVLRRAGYNARGWVGGYRATGDALTRAEELNVVVDLRRQAG